MDRTHSFGYWLRRRRKALDLTQADLAQQVSCSVDLIQKIEADARRPSRQLAEQLPDRSGPRRGGAGGLCPGRAGGADRGSVGAAQPTGRAAAAFVSHQPARPAHSAARRSRNWCASGSICQDFPGWRGAGRVLARYGSKWIFPM